MGITGYSYKVNHFSIDVSVIVTYIRETKLLLINDKQELNLNTFVLLRNYHKVFLSFLCGGSFSIQG